MNRYAAFLRGVSPLNCRMPELKRCLEKAGLRDVATVLSSGNVVFSAGSRGESALEKLIEKATQEDLGRGFGTIVRSIDSLEELLESDPFKPFRLKPESKRVVTFFKAALAKSFRLPPETEGARILQIQGREALTAYVPTPGNPAFMKLIEKTFGKEVTTRTWETLLKVQAKK